MINNKIKRDDRKMWFSTAYNNVGKFITGGYQMVKSTVKKTYNSARFITDTVGFGLRSLNDIVSALADVPLVQQNLPPVVQPSLDYVLDVYTGFEDIVYNQLPLAGELIDRGFMNLFDILNFPQPIEASA